MYKGYVDLHLHLDGSLCDRTVQKLLAHEAVRLSDADLIAQTTVTEDCKCLEDYLKCFKLPQMLLQTQYALELAAYDLICELAAQGLIYTEIRFAPQKHTLNGLSQEDAVKSVFAGIKSAMRDFPTINVGVILCFIIGGEGNEETLRVAEKFCGDKIVGIDLAGPEWKASPDSNKKLFRRAIKTGIPFTIHAGESGPFTNIEKAVEMGARRIGHGCAAIQSEKCMRLLKENHIVIECCPTSNIQTKAVANIQNHPIKRFFDYGLLVTINTDNMLVSNTTVAKEHDILSDAFAFSDDDYLEMDMNAIEGAFLPLIDKVTLIEKVRSYRNAV